jgi:hypothetical protein
VAKLVKVAISEDAAKTTTVPEMLGVSTAAGAELAGALLEAAAGAEDVPVLGATADADVAGVEVAAGAADDGDDAAFFEELHPARPRATMTVLTTTAAAFRFMNSPRRVKGRRLIGVRY